MEYNSASRLANLHGTAQMSDAQILDADIKNWKRFTPKSVYIPPKNIPAEDMEQPEQYASQVAKPDPVPQEQSHKNNGQFLKVADEVKQSVMEKDKDMKENKIEKVGKKSYRSSWLNLLEVLIWCGFFISSFPIEALLIWVDIGVNCVCLLKIIGYHIYVVYLNKKISQATSKDQQEEQKKATPTSAKFYTNSIKIHELFQIWSILLTILGLAFLHHEMIFLIMISLKVLRLFFPIAIRLQPALDLPVFEVFVHVLKLVLFGAIITLIASMFITFLYNENFHYRCISTAQLMDLYDSDFENFIPQNYLSCGIKSSCPLDQTCLNIYRYATEASNFRTVNQALKDEKLATYDKTILHSFLLTSDGGAVFNTYKGTEVSLLLFIVFLFLWFIGICWGASTVGETLRSQTLYDWKKKELQQICVFKQLTAGKARYQRRNSNISFNLQRYRRQMCRPIQQSQNSESSAQINEEMDDQFGKINEEMANRSVKQKLATILFNLLCLSQVILVYLDNLNIDPVTDLNISIALASYFILWTIGLLAAVIQSKFCQKDISHEHANQNYILWYEGVAYSLTLIDYLIRVSQPEFLIQRQNFMTPLAQAAISLRIIYILYNNGFDAQISCYFEKIMRNIWSNKRMVCFILIVGISSGFAQMNWRMEGKLDGGEIGMMNNWTLMSTGFGGSLENRLDSILMFGVFKVLGIIFGLYVAKNVNLGYDSIFDVNFPLEQKTNPQEIQTQIESELVFGCFSAENSFRKFCRFLHELPQYSYLKCLAIIAYAVMTFMSVTSPHNQTSPIVLLILDIWLIFDILIQIIAIGLKNPHSYFSKYKIPKILHCLTQIYLFIIFFVPGTVIMPLTVFFRLTKLLILCQNYSTLTKVSDQIVTIFLTAKMKYYKIILSSIGLLFMALAITSRFASSYDLPVSNKILNSIGYAMNLVYGIGYGYPADDFVKSMNILALCILAIGFFIFYHILTVFMTVTYFVVTRNSQKNQEDDLVLQNFLSPSPDEYDYTVTTNYNIFAYLKVLKIGLICISIGQICLLFGLIDYKVNTQTRILLAAINLFIALVEICIYFWENISLKIPKLEWPVGEALMIIVSLPGAFLLMFPPANFSGSFELKLVIQIFLSLSVVRLCRIFPLLMNRQGYSLATWRRIKNTIPFEQFTGAMFIVICLMLPFAVAFSLLRQSDIIQTIFSFIAGPSFSTNPQDIISVEEVLLKLFASIIYFPMKSFCLAKIISSFLTNNPSWLTIRKDKIKDVIAQSGILDENRSNLYVKNNQFYKIAACMLKLMPPTLQERAKKHRKVKLDYDTVTAILKKLNIQIYIAEQTNDQDESPTAEFMSQYHSQKNYALLVSDLIYYLYQYAAKPDAKFDRSQISSLMNKEDNKPDGLIKTQMGTHEYSILMGMKNKLVYRIAKKSKQNVSKKKGEQYLAQQLFSRSPE